MGNFYFFMDMILFQVTGQMCHLTIPEFALSSVYRKNFRKFINLDPLWTVLIIVYVI